MHIGKADKIARTYLFWLNGISHEEKLMNFAFLLKDDESSNFTVADLYKNDDVVNELIVSSGHEQGVVERIFNLKELCVDVWQDCASK